MIAEKGLHCRIGIQAFRQISETGLDTNQCDSPVFVVHMEFATKKHLEYKTVFKA